MKIGAKPWKVAALGGLLLILAIAIYSNLTSDDRPPSARAAASRPAARTVPAEISVEPPAPETRSRPAAHPESRQLRLNMKDQHADPATVDPTIRVDLLAKVQTVSLAGGERNLFQFGAAPLPKTADPRINVPPLPPSVSSGAQDLSAPQEVKTPVPPVPLKLYGFSTNPRSGTKKAFFLQGEDILVGAEGELLQHRYKVVRIGINTCVVEDTEFKDQQTLKLEEQPG